MVPELSAVVVHWRDENHLERLARAWPKNPRFELVVVDNGSDGSLAERLAGERIEWVDEGNLGFGGGVNAGARRARGDLLLILNPDVGPVANGSVGGGSVEGALEELLKGFKDYPAAAGVVPRLVGPEGQSQSVWQLRPLPRLRDLIKQAFFVPSGESHSGEPAAGSTIEQPAAAALALRREAFEAVGGFDAGFYPAWFEDVDFARRLGAAGHSLVYHPAAVFEHALGSTVASLGYGPFLWIYYRNLVYYTAKHHGAPAAFLIRALLPVTALLRALFLPLRRPRRAASRGSALSGLWTVAWGALTGWRRPLGMRRRFGGAS